MNTPEMPKAYNPAEYENKISELWEKNHAFEADSGVKAQAGDSAAQNSQPFSIVMPPPNANGVLHAGHLMYVVEDIATRFARMQGRPTLWLPGTDHAGIETQYVYEKELAKKGLSRFDLGPEKFYDEVMAFTKKHQAGALAGFKSMGFSADWSKLKFTLDEDIIDVVYDVFIRMHKDGHIYRGNRIVNWCPRCQAAFPDIETEHIDRDDAMYTLDYGTIKIATTRPETIFADVAVAVNSKDQNYETLIGKTATIPLVDRIIPVIGDEHVDPDSGTGALKVTPAHDKNDYEIGLRHNLAEISVIDEQGKMINVPEEFAGMEVLEARQAVVAALQKAGKLIKTTPLTHAIATHDRCGTPIELIMSEQWFLRVKELNKPVIDALENDKITIYPSRYKRVALNWLNQEHDWCISRPGWWGIRIPVFYKTSNDPDKDAYMITKNEAEATQYYGAGNYRAETDTFDTWFSSSQWPYATLMTSGEGDFNNFYPTSLMGTAAEILHKWVTRMVMFGIYATGKIPFEKVYLWGTVTDEKGQKLSKSKGNYEDPMQITAKYGTDALRMALSIGITAGNNGSLHNEKVQGYRNFCNKLWNVARYTLSKTSELTSLSPVELQTPADHWMALQINSAISTTTTSIETYRYSEAGQAVYTLLWDQLADQYIEYSKQTTNPMMLAYALDTVLRLAHPFAPFVTEAIWQELPWQDSILITETWPKKMLEPNAEMAKQFELDIIAILAAQQKQHKQVEAAKLQKEISAKLNLIKITEAKLNNPAFVQNAPAELVEGEKAKLVTVRAEISALEAILEAK
jgi:valyl-tRNA synthetase